MPHLIIGHTADTAAKIWIRGDRMYRRADVTVRPVGGVTSNPQKVKLSRSRDYIAVIEIPDLEPDRPYAVHAQFRSWLKPDQNRYGRFRTFPAAETSQLNLRFLLGSCNVSVVTMSNLLGMLGGTLGLWAIAESTKNSAIRMVWNGFVWFILKIRLNLKRFKLPGPPRIQSPFDELRRILCKMRPAFMIHAGDQIYFDIPEPDRVPEQAAYRSKYREAWFQDPSARKFLARCPQYMTLDDHEIIEQFAKDCVPPNDGLFAPSDYLEPAKKVYCEYVHSRHPGIDDGLYYNFSHGRTRFFVMDTRTERRIGQGEIIGATQMECLLAWLEKYRNDVKFVVSSVPFIAEVRSSTDVPPQIGEANDKWSGPIFRTQRAEIIEFIYANKVRRLIFLAGDMHCCYHASMVLGPRQDRRMLHELGCGPLYQLRFAQLKDFHARHEEAMIIAGEKVRVSTRLRAFHTGASAAMSISLLRHADSESDVEWSVLRTIGVNDRPSPLSGRIAI